jgi:uncharacterized integral membrane protein
MTNPPSGYPAPDPPQQPPSGSQGPPNQSGPYPPPNQSGRYPPPDQSGPYPPPDQSGAYRPGPPGAGDDQLTPSDAPDDAAAAPGAAGAAADAQHRAPAAGFDDRGKVRPGKVSALWVGLVAVAVILILLIIFIAQNLDRVTIHFLGFAGSLPVGLVALIAAVIGVLIAAVPGTVRILQLRKALKKNTPKEQRLP